MSLFSIAILSDRGKFSRMYIYVNLGERIYTSFIDAKYKMQIFSRKDRLRDIDAI